MFAASSLKSVSWFVVNLINELRTFNFPETPVEFSVGYPRFAERVAVS